LFLLGIPPNYERSESKMSGFAQVLCWIVAVVIFGIGVHKAVFVAWKLLRRPRTFFIKNEDMYKMAIYAPLMLVSEWFMLLAVDKGTAWGMLWLPIISFGLIAFHGFIYKSAKEDRRGIWQGSQA
jgi:hypothetical protein